MKKYAEGEWFKKTRVRREAADAMETMKIIPMLIHRANRQEVQVVIEIVGEDPLAKRGCLREYPHWTTLGETPLSRGICHQSFHLQSPTPP